MAMQKIFNQIVVPVDSVNIPGPAIEKLLAFSGQLQCHLHLLFINEPSYFQKKAPWLFVQKRPDPKMVSIYQHLEDIQSKYQPGMPKGLKLITSLREGDIENEIAGYAELQDIDMILLSHQLYRGSFEKRKIDTGRLAGQTHCPVLITDKLPDLSELDIIVLPVDDSLPVNKIRISIYLARQFNAVIHLLALENKKEINGIDYLKRTYIVLKENTDQPFVCHTVREKDLARAAIHYARSVNAGLVVAKPGEDLTGHFSFIRRFVTRSQEKNTKVPVMTVA
jgi:nucleotide-binding universal stress UspA family protein